MQMYCNSKELSSLEVILILNETGDHDDDDDDDTDFQSDYWDVKTY